MQDSKQTGSERVSYVEAFKRIQEARGLRKPTPDSPYYVASDEQASEPKRGFFWWFVIAIMVYWHILRPMGL